MRIIKYGNLHEPNSLRIPVLIYLHETNSLMTLIFMKVSNSLNIRYR